jgi:hypothetical protein
MIGHFLIKNAHLINSLGNLIFRINNVNYLYLTIVGSLLLGTIHRLAFEAFIF